MGAICIDKGCVHFQLYKRSVDRWKFIEWLEGFKRKIGKKGCYLYMDNLAVHKTEEVSEKLQQCNIEAIFAPAYSPELNAIEFYFSMLK